VRVTPEDVVLIRRVRQGRVYYLAPGVAMREEETPGAAAVRAGREELGLEVTVDEMLHAQAFGGVDHFFFSAAAVSEIDDTVPAPASDEFELEGEADGSYEIATLPARMLLAYDVRPWELAQVVARAR
jgi:ADP-ribose pyrophosphatase YjhB (NUDIX family)